MSPISPYERECLNIYIARNGNLHASANTMGISPNCMRAHFDALVEIAAERIDPSIVKFLYLLKKKHRDELLMKLQAQLKAADEMLSDPAFN